MEARVFSRTRYTFALGAKRSDPEPEASVEHTEVTARIERRAHQTRRQRLTRLQVVSQPGAAGKEFLSIGCPVRINDVRPMAKRPPPKMGEDQDYFFGGK